MMLAISAHNNDQTAKGWRVRRLSASLIVASSQSCMKASGARLATPYDKRALNYWSAVIVVPLMIWLTP